MTELGDASQNACPQRQQITNYPLRLELNINKDPACLIAYLARSNRFTVTMEVSVSFSNQKECKLRPQKFVGRASAIYPRARELFVMIEYSVGSV